MAASYPNILIAGTPCTGKSTLSKEVAKRTGMEWIDISDLAIKEKLIQSFDEEFQCPVIDERKVVKFLKPLVKCGGKIIDYHGCSFFPRRKWFSAVFVPRTETSILYDRLESRGYKGRKLNDNMECEIFQVLLEEAHETFDPQIVHEIHNNTEKDIDKNVDFILSILNNLREIPIEED
ncbi:adenylate kinase isoenzyme 6-like [Rhodnius prolixus]|uniref:Adenylate kinase isoenzyme 6 homolog n=2 Tax=Rhodnius TaxID=13248 RepID=R4FJY4_RHOPR